VPEEPVTVVVARVGSVRAVTVAASVYPARGRQGFSKSNTHSGVVGQNFGGGFGVLGEADGANTAVAGVNTGAGPGVVGRSDGPNSAGDGVQGFASSNSRSGVVGTHNFGGVGVLGQANGPKAAVAGVNTGTGAGIFGKGGGLAGQFEGNVDVTGKLAVGGSVGVQLDLAVNGTIGTMKDVQIGRRTSSYNGTKPVAEAGGLRFIASAFRRPIIRIGWD
jgi:hypothetical protein